MGISSTQRARGDTPYVHSCKGMSEGAASDPRPGSWPVFSTEHSEGPRYGLRMHHLGCDREQELDSNCSYTHNRQTLTG